MVSSKRLVATDFANDEQTGEYEKRNFIFAVISLLILVGMGDIFS